jgi:membrane associated rhomboid family serine protease
MNDSHPACYRHPNTPTKLRCSECGRYICAECSVDAPVGQRCPECAKERGTTRVVNRNQILGGPSFQTAPVTMTLIAINVLVFVAQAMSPDLDTTIFETFAAANWLIRGGEIYRIVTSMFLHAGIFHVGLNMYALYILGPTLERSVKSWPFAGLYFGSGIVGGLTAVVLSSGPSVGVGASGAIFGIFGAWFLHGYRTRHTAFGDALFRQMAALLIINAVISLGIPQISWQAHLGGFLGGVFITWVWQLLPRESNTVAVRTTIGAVVSVLGLVAAWML